MEVRLAKEADSVAWDKVNDESENGTFFHRWDCLKLLEKHTKSRLLGSESKGKLYPMIGFENDDAVAIFPIFAYGKLFTSIFSPPLSTGITHMGPVFRNYLNLPQYKREILVEDFIKGVESLMRKELKPVSVKVQTSSGFDDPRMFHWLGYDVEPMYDYEIQLTKDEKSLFSDTAPQIRTNVRNALEAGLKFNEGGEEEIKLLFEILSRRYSEQKLNLNISLGYLLELYKKFTQNIKVFVVKDQNEIAISGTIVFIHKDTIYLWLGSCRQKDIQTFTNDFMNWRIIMWARENGYHKCVNLWANSQRLCEYKSKYNPSPLIYYSISINSRLFKTMKLTKKLKNNILGVST